MNDNDFLDDISENDEINDDIEGNNDFESYEEDLFETFENSGLLEDEYDDYDEVYLHDSRKPKSWKPREHRLWVRLFTKAVILIVIVGGLFLGIAYGFKLEVVNITGNYAYSDEDILEILNYDRYHHNALLFWWKNRKEITEGIPFIEYISVHLAGARTINVNVSEKMIIGCIDDGGLYMYFDNTGTVVESSTTKTDGIALVTGVNISGVEIGDQMDISDRSVFNNLYELSVLLKKYNLSVDRIDYKKDQTMVMCVDDIEILLGTGQNLEDKINAYKDLENSLEGMAGKLHLEDYNSTKKSIFFSKDS